MDALSTDSSVIRQSFRYFAVNAGYISLLVLPTALLGGVLQALIWKSFFINQKHFPLLGPYLGSRGAAGLVIMLAQLMIMMFWVGALIYLIKSVASGVTRIENEFSLSPQAEAKVSSVLKPALREVFAQGFMNWGKLSGLVLMMFLFSQGPAYIAAFFHMNHGWVFNVVVMSWVIVSVLIIVWRYALIFPVMVIEESSIISSLHMSAILSEGRRGEILLVSVSLFLFAYVGMFAVTSLLGFLTEPLQSEVIINLILNSFGVCFIKWFLLAPLFIALCLLYQKGKNEVEVPGQIKSSRLFIR